MDPWGTPQVMLPWVEKVPEIPTTEILLHKLFLHRQFDFVIVVTYLLKYMFEKSTTSLTSPFQTQSLCLLESEQSSGRQRTRL